MSKKGDLRNKAMTSDSAVKHGHSDVGFEQPMISSPAEDPVELAKAVSTLADIDAEWPDLPAAILADIGRVSSEIDHMWVEGLEHVELSEDDQQWVRQCVRENVERGFVFAVYRYAEWLKSVPEVRKWNDARLSGGDAGRQTSSRRKAELAQRIREKWAAMEAAGEKVTNDTVAAAMRTDGWKCSRATVIRAFKSDQPK